MVLSLSLLLSLPRTSVVLAIVFVLFAVLTTIRLLTSASTLLRLLGGHVLLVPLLFHNYIIIYAPPLIMML